MQQSESLLAVEEDLVLGGREHSYALLPVPTDGQRLAVAACGPTHLEEVASDKAPLEGFRLDHDAERLVGSGIEEQALVSGVHMVRNRSRLTPPSSATEAGHARRRAQKKLNGQPLFAGARG